jgi:hypothetical protein
MIFETDQIFLKSEDYDKLKHSFTINPESVNLNEYDSKKELTPFALRMVFATNYKEKKEDYKLILKIITKICNDVQSEDFKDELFAIQFKLLIDNFNPDNHDITDEELENYDNNVSEKYDILQDLIPHKVGINFDELTLENPIAKLNLIDRSEYWRLYVDGDKQRKQNEKGWVGYEEREPGCIEGMHKAFLHMLDNWKEPLTIREITAIHDIALSSIKNGSDRVTKGFRGNGTSTGFQYFSLDRALSTSFVSENLKYGSTLKLYHNVAKRYFSGKLHLDFFEKRINEYETNLVKASDSNEKKLQAIVEFSYDMLKWHPFCDGNSRTFITIILNKELMRNGFSPCILNDPLIFEAYVGPNALMHAVQEGIKNFNKLTESREIVNLPNDLKTPELSKSALPPSLSDFPTQDSSLRLR